MLKTAKNLKPGDRIKHDDQVVVVRRAWKNAGGAILVDYNDTSATPYIGQHIFNHDDRVTVIWES